MNMSITMLTTDEIIADAHDGDTVALAEIVRRVEKGVKPKNQRKMEAFLAASAAQVVAVAPAAPQEKKVSNPHVGLRANAWAARLNLRAHGVKITYAQACEACGTFPAKSAK